MLSVGGGGGTKTQAVASDRSQQEGLRVQPLAPERAGAAAGAAGRRRLGFAMISRFMQHSEINS